MKDTTIKPTTIAQPVLPVRGSARVAGEKIDDVSTSSGVGIQEESFLSEQLEKEEQKREQRQREVRAQRAALLSLTSKQLAEIAGKENQIPRPSRVVLYEVISQQLSKEATRGTNVSIRT